MSSREEIIIDPVDGLRQRLAVMLEEQQRRQIANGRYFTDGSKARMTVPSANSAGRSERWRPPEMEPNIVHIDDAMQSLRSLLALRRIDIVVMNQVEGRVQYRREVNLKRPVTKP